ncbi:MAG TPA: DUF4340 domain-containing protein [Myxococcota bacterium]|nr:DUF4340 domain-containing protein [Myxococcota bacterium]
MKKSTLFLVAAALVLGVVVLLVKSGGDKPAPKKLDIAGYASAEDLERDKKRGLMDPAIVIAHPIDEVILEREDGKIRMVRDGEGDKATWRIAEPVDAVAVKWHVDAIVDVFRSPTTRSDARNIKPADFPLFDFEPSRRIGLTLKSKGAVWNGVELIVGQLVKESGGDMGDGGDGVKGTWVMVKGDETVAYLLAGKDLRTPVNKTLSELRDKKVFAFEGDDISKIEITPESGPKVVLTSTTTEEPPAPDAGPDAKPTKKTTWALTEPANVKGDAAVASIARSLGSLRAEDFIPLDKADEAGKKALAGPAWRYAMTVDGKTETLIIAEGDKDKAWAQVEGRNELMTLSAWTAKNLEKGLEDLKDKTVWDHPLDSVTRLTLSQESGGAMTLIKDGTSWTFADGVAAFTADPSSILSGVAKLSAVRWARASEVEDAKKLLATPAITAAVEAAGKTLEVRFSAPLEGDDAQNRWGVVGDPASGEPFLVSDFTAKRFVSKPETLRNKRVFADVIDQAAAITVTLAGSTDTVRFEKGEGGQFRLLGLLPSETQNDEAVRSLVSTLGALEVKSFHEGKNPTETGLSSDKSHVVGLELADGRRLSLLVSQTSSGDAEVYGLASDGPQKDVPVGLNEYQTKNIAKARADFVNAAAPQPAP